MGERKSEARDETIMKYRAKTPPLGSKAKKTRTSIEILALFLWVVALPTYERKTGLKPATLSLEG